MRKEKLCLKDMIIPIIMSLVISFMLFIYEPIITYATNTSDYWFNFSPLITNNLLIFLIILAILNILSFVIYFIAKLFKNKLIFNIYIVLMFVSFVATYIQGNFLAGSLPTLDGSPIIWSNYAKDSIISIVLWIIIIALNIFLYIKFKKNYNNIIKYTSLAVFAMLLASLCSTLLTNKEIYTEKGTFTSTNENINSLSKNKNFLILLTDCVDASDFSKVIENTKSENVFKDFTYYPDTLATYGFTRDSVPFIFSGIWYEAKTSFSEHYLYAFNNSKLFHTLKDQNYDINIYDEDLWIPNNDTYNINNVKKINSNVKFIPFVKQEAKYILFKYLPFPLKRYSKIEWLDYSLCKDEIIKDTDKRVFSALDKTNYDLIDDVNVQDNNYFQFLHIEGGHYPFNLNGKMESIKNGTYEDKLEATITFIKKYLKRIKDSGQYDNTAIIIISDHGFNGYEHVGRQNPILFIKGFNEKHDMQTSNKKVSFEDLNEIYIDLLDDKQNKDMLKNIKNNRVRRYLFYKEYDKMYEQLLDGHAWETDKLKNTGKKYFR